FLALDAPTGKALATVVQAPQGVDTKIVADDSEPGAQQESCDDEPSFFVLYREASAVDPCLESRPKGTQQGPVPSAPGCAEDGLQALKDSASSQLGLFTLGA